MIEVASFEHQNIMSWYDAVLYCQFLDHNGHTDWRMPLADELKIVPRELIRDFITGRMMYIWTNEDLRDSIALKDGYDYARSISLDLTSIGYNEGALYKQINDINFVVPIRGS